MKSWLLIVGISLLLVLSGCSSKAESKEVEEFAKCLTENGAVMYGAFWCPHCSRTKKKIW